MIPENYLEKVYSAFLGKCIGIRLGAPVEPSIWSMDRIEKVYGYIDHYVKPYKIFAADDDSNGPAYFIRALFDDYNNGKLTSEAVANAWLNYSREGVGMFWWGGYGISTEHTAYLNLKEGIKAPDSGSIKTNGDIIAQQIGGQIFIDTFGLVNPCNPEKAANYGEIAARVSHDGEAILGARFFCAAIAHAFCTNDIDEIIEVGLSTIPNDSDYYKVARAVKNFYEKNPNDFRACMKMLDANWGMDKFLGNCHIIPNAGVCFLAFYYGQGDFTKSIEIACTCGMDTDCNAGNIATVLGITNGISGLPAKYRDPINDGIVLSGISGYLNILDFSTFSKEICMLGYKIAGKEPPKSLSESLKFGNLFFDFEIPGAIHNFRASDPCLCQISQKSGIGDNSNGCLEILYSQFYRGQKCKIFYKPFYTRADFSDERYRPVFSPQVVSGQRVKLSLFNEQWLGLSPDEINFYVKTINENEYIASYNQFEVNKWHKAEFIVPDTNGETICEVGFIMEGTTSKKDRSRGRLLIDNFEVYGKGKYSIDISKQITDVGSITPFSHSEVSWRKVDNKIQSLRCKSSFSFTGNYYAGDQKITVNVKPENGLQHLLMVRAKGIMRGYYAGFNGIGKISILKNDFGLKELISVPFDWKYDKEYKLVLKAEKDIITLFIDNIKLLSVNDNSFKYGMLGFGSTTLGRTTFSDIEIETEVKHGGCLVL